MGGWDVGVWGVVEGQVDENAPFVEVTLPLKGIIFKDPRVPTYGYALDEMRQWVPTNGSLRR